MKKINVLTLVVFVLCAISSFAQQTSQNQTEKRKPIKIEPFKAGRVLSHEDILFLSALTKAPDGQTASIKEASLGDKKFTEGEKLTSADAKVISEKAVSTAKDKKLERSVTKDGRPYSCDYCFVNCNVYGQWFDAYGFCWCTWCR